MINKTTKNIRKMIVAKLLLKHANKNLAYNKYAVKENNGHRLHLPLRNAMIHGRSTIEGNRDGSFNND